jgi:hypothetical protein
VVGSGSGKSAGAGRQDNGNGHYVPVSGGSPVVRVAGQLGKSVLLVKVPRPWPIGRDCLPQRACGGPGAVGGLSATKLAHRARLTT